MMTKLEPTIFVIEDDLALCKSLEWLFSSVNLATEIFHSGLDYLKSHDPNRIGCILIDVRLPGMSGLELQQNLIHRNNTLPIIFITGYGDVTIAVRAMKAGAKDFILKPFIQDVLLDQIQNTIVESCKLYKLYKLNPDFIKGFASLSVRENEVVKLMIDGLLNKQIACVLDIAISTVEKHRANIMLKTKSKSLVELVKHYFLMIRK